MRNWIGVVGSCAASRRLWNGPNRRNVGDRWGGVALIISAGGLAAVSARGRLAPPGCVVVKGVAMQVAIWLSLMSLGKPQTANKAAVRMTGR